MGYWRRPGKQLRNIIISWDFWVIITIPLIFLGVTSFIEIFVFKDCSLEPWIYDEEKREAKIK
jgi:hypothetical protein